jgi:hypothetical protein
MPRMRGRVCLSSSIGSSDFFSFGISTPSDVSECRAAAELHARSCSSIIGCDGEVVRWRSWSGVGSYFRIMLHAQSRLRVTIDRSLTSLRCACCFAPNAFAYRPLEVSAGSNHQNQLLIRQSVSNHPLRDGLVWQKPMTIR